MPVNTEGFAELVGQIEKMAHQLNTDEEGAPTAKRILQAAAQPIHQQMKANASHDPKIITGKLHGVINIGKVKRRRNGGQNITIGVHRKDWDEPEYVPAYVEYGHGGPAPAPAHPYIRPAYDTRQNEAYLGDISEKNFYVSNKTTIAQCRMYLKTNMALLNIRMMPVFDADLPTYQLVCPDLLEIAMAQMFFECMNTDGYNIGVCAVCGAPFPKTRKNNTLCEECQRTKYQRTRDKQRMVANIKKESERTD